MPVTTIPPKPNPPIQNKTVSMRPSAFGPLFSRTKYIERLKSILALHCSDSNSASKALTEIDRITPL